MKVKTRDVKLSPKLIYEEMSRSIEGQEEAKRAVASILYSNYVGNVYNSVPGRKPVKRPAMLLSGPSGNGKTYLVQKGIDAIQKILGIPIMPLITIDCANLSYGPWRGTTVADYIESFLASNRENRAYASSAILYFDEVDKLAIAATDSSGNDHNKLIQYSLLKLLEGLDVIIEGKYVGGNSVFNTSQCTFIFSGNFAERRAELDKSAKTEMGFTGGTKDVSFKDLPLSTQLQKIGFATQLAGRISQMVEIERLDEKQLEQIVRKHLLPPLIEFYGMQQYTLYISNEQIDTIVQEAIKMKTGARGLQAALDKIALEMTFEDVSYTETFYQASDADSPLRITFNYVKTERPEDENE